MLDLTKEERHALRTVFLHAERVNWAAYDRARRKILDLLDREEDDAPCADAYPLIFEKS